MQSSDAIYRFGAFELDCAAGELRKRGLRVKLQEQSLKILISLVERPGKAVTRQQLQEDLWPPGTFVDSDNAINSAVWKLRECLGDTAGNPRFIETLSRKGYRFIADVQILTQPLIQTLTQPPARTPPETQAPVPICLSITASPDSLTDPFPASAANRIIVLPFRTLPRDVETEFLAYTLPEALSGSLLAIDSLVVRSTAMALSFPDSLDYREVGAKAEVDAIVTGSLMRTGGQLICTCQLLDAHAGTLRWSETVSVPSSGLFELQQGLTNRIADSLRLTLSARERRNLVRDVPRSDKAYEYYLRANQFAFNRNLQNSREARDLYLRSLQEDSDFAPAWAQFGRVCRFLWKFGDEPAETADLANQAFQRAFTLNPDLALAHNLYTSVQCDEGKGLDAMQRLVARARSRPHDPDLFAGLVQACRYCGELKASISAHSRAVRLQSNIITSVPMTYFLMSDYRRAVDTIGPRAAYYLDCAALAALGENETALERLRQREHLGDASGVVRAIMSSLKACLEGRPAECVRFIEEGEILTRRDPESLFFSARHLARVNEPERAIKTLHSALDAGFLFPPALNDDPWLEPLLASPGFAGIIEKTLHNRNQAHTAFLEAGGDRILDGQAALY